MKVKNRAISLVLTLALLLSCITTGAFAADGNIEFNISFEKYDQETHKIVAGAVDQVKNGDVVVVSFMMKNNYSTTQFIGSYDALMKFDGDIFSGFVDSSDVDLTGPFYRSYATDTSGSSFVVNVVNGTASIHGATLSGVVVKAGETVTIGKIALKVADKAEKTTTNFTFDLNGKNLVAEVEDDKKTLPVNAAAVSTITIDGITPELSTVKLDDKDTITVTVDGKTDKTVNATATSAQGTNLTDMVTWSVAPTDNGVSIDATTGTITVGAKAKADDYTITATGNGTTATGSANATLKVAREAQTYTVTVTPKSMEMTVPASDENKGSFSATVTNQYDETMTGGVTWSISSTDDNVSINSSTGEVTVKAEAKNTIEGTTGTEFTVTATYGENTGSATMTVKREESRVSSIELAKDANTRFEVPTVDKTNHGVPKGVDFPTVTVKDQYGEKISAAEVTWTLGNDKPDGVSIDENGKLVISSSVAANDGFADNKLEFTAIASYGGVSKEVTLTLTRELSTATSVEISGGKSEFTIPVDETADKATFTAVVKDQYGQPVTGDNATVTWSITPSVTGVNFDNGAVSVTKDAKSGTTSSQEFTVTAKCGNAEDTETFTVERAESVVTAIEYTGNTNVVVPDGNSTNECAITLTFKDQYGTEMTSGVDSNNLEWICPKGIMVETGSGTYNVKVSKDALKHFGNERKNSVEVKITAKYGDLTKEIPVTLNLANAVVTTVQLNGDNSIMIPKTVGSVNTKTYTVTVFDQYGFELPDKAENATYTFTAADANVTCTGYGSDNESKAGAAEVKVSYGATAKSYTLVATVESKDSTAKTIEVKDKTEDTKTLKVVQNNVVFGSKIEPTVTGKPQDSTDLVYSYEGVDGTTYDSSTVAPTNVGKYKVTVTCETADTFYTKTINFEITA